MRRFWMIAAAGAVAGLLLCGCAAVSSVKETVPAAPVVLELAIADAEVPLSELGERYPHLQKLDMTGYTDYAGIESYIADHPQVEVIYSVSLGNRSAAPDTEHLALTREDFNYPSLVANLKYLRRLQSVHFENTTLLPDAIGNLRAVYPNLAITYSVDFCGLLCDSTAETLDLSLLDPETVLARVQLLTMLPEVHTVELMTPEGTTPFTLEQAARLQALAPQVQLHYSFDLFGKRVSTDDREITYTNQNLAAQAGALDTLRMALSILGGCERFVLDNCKFSNETLAQLREEFRGRTKVVWRVWFAEGGCLTDRQVIRYVYGLYDSNCANLIYCEDAEFIDIGHNEYLKNCEFVSHMKNLRAIILSGSMVSDLSPLANCESLEFLELTYCGYVEDLSPLASCTNLKRLNIAFTKVADLSPLDALPLEVFVDARSKTDPQERERFDAVHPECLVQHTGDAKDDQPYAYPWRYAENGDPNEYYALLQEKFHYPDAFTTLY